MTPRAAVIAGFAAVLAVAVAVDLAARRQDSGVRPLSAALTAVMRSRSGRVVVFGAWLWLGWHFLAR
ncbi:DUF6186 family protein [Actinoplanes sp. NPDC004185]